MWSFIIYLAFSLLLKVSRFLPLCVCVCVCVYLHPSIPACWHFWSFLEVKFWEVKLMSQGDSMPFLKDFIYLFLERGEGREEERERNINVREKHWSVASHTRPVWAPSRSRDRTWSSDMCPDHESNWQPFALWDDAEPTEPRWSGLLLSFLQTWALISSTESS